MNAEELKLLSDLIDDGNQMVLWLNKDTKTFHKLNSMNFNRNGSVTCHLDDGQYASLDDPYIKLSDFVAGNKINSDEWK